MTDHPDIDELFASDDDDDEGSDDAETSDPTAEPDDERDPFADEPDDDDDLVALVDEVASRYEPLTPDAEPATAASPSPGPEAAPPAPAEAGVPAATTPDPPGGDSASGGGLLLQFPSQDFPPPPVFRVRVPDGWLAVPLPDALMAVRRPEPVDGFHPNVLVRSRRVLAANEPGVALAELAEQETVPEGMELMGEGLATEGPTPARWVEIRFTGPDGTVLRARHLLVYVPASDHVANVLSVVGTWPDAAGDEPAREVTDVVGSLRLFRPARGT